MGNCKRSQGIRDFYPRSPCGERRGMRWARDPVTGISIHALLAESDLNWGGCLTIPLIFLSTLSLRRATGVNKKEGAKELISIHALLAESDYHILFVKHDLFYFYPRSPCGERPGFVQRHCRSKFISIHALLAESDPYLLGKFWYLVGISIHALLAESDVCI